MFGNVQKIREDLFLVTVFGVLDDCSDEATLELLLGTGWDKWSVHALDRWKIRMAGRRVLKTAVLLKFHGLTLQIPERHHLAAQGKTINQRFRRTSRLDSSLCGPVIIPVPHDSCPKTFKLLLSI